MTTPPPAPPPDGWWETAFTRTPTPSELLGHPCASHEMLTIIAYDITHPRRLAKIARHCENHGVRIQYSVFECHLPADDFEIFWISLTDLIDPAQDRLIAYRICAHCAKDILAAGQMTPTAPPIAYVY